MKKRATGLGHITLLWRRFVRNDQVILTILAVLIGVTVAYGTIGFRELLGAVQNLLYGFSTEDVFSRLGQLTWWHVLLAPAVGGLAVGLALHFLMPGRRNQGIADVIEAGALHGGRMSLNLGIKAFVVNAAALGAGASAGREGPMVHLGGSIAAYVARRFHLNPSLALTLLGCGVAAGVAAAFNAPLAGTFFALEVVIGHYALQAFAPVVISAVAGTVIARIHFGDFPAFIIPDYVIGSFFEFPSFFLLGIVCAAVAILFMRSIMFAEDMVNRSQAPIWIRPAAGGLAVGLMAIFLPQVLGVGYEATDTALKGGFGVWLLLTLIVAKTAATAISLGCRFGASVFSPALFVGAMTGGAFGIIAGGVFPELASSPGFYAMVGMAAVVAPVLGAPISTTLIAFELTGEFAVTIAVVVAIVVSSIITQQVTGRSFFHWQLERRGLRLRGGRIEQLLKANHVRDIMTSEYACVGEDMAIADIRDLLQNSAFGDLFVTGKSGELLGSITFADLKGVAFESGLDSLIIARDIMRPRPPVLMPAADLEDAIGLMDKSGQDCLPVVEIDGSMQVIGIVHHKAAMVAYNRALLQARAEEHDGR